MDIELLMRLMLYFTGMAVNVFAPLAGVGLGFGLGFAIVDKVRGLLGGVQ
jgi:hypothetical protein